MARPKSSTKKKEIIKSVEKLITNKGVNEISLQDIASECGISKGTLYYHYASKEAIILDIIVKHMQELEDDYIDWFERHKIEKDISPERFLDVIFYKGVKLFNRAKMHIFIINECVKNNKKLLEKYNELWNKWKEDLTFGISKVFPSMINPSNYADLLMLIIDGLVVREVMQRKDISQEKLVELVKSLGVVTNGK
ncbi:MAG: TetR/AcrR family transcriptional regulator [Erysipelotrichales bacterium]|nr:TetR/AcrR family transcriptional regulator [Erysipelotrichales bacterium]